MVVINLSTPEQYAKFEQAYVKALIAHMSGQPLDLKAVAEEAGVVEPDKTEEPTS